MVGTAVILAGGTGTRLSEETDIRPKPLVEIGGRPILWHIMKIYHAAGVRDFVICLGYKGYMIKEYFANYLLHVSDVTIDFAYNSTEYISQRAEDWRVTLIDTGNDAMTGGRIKRVAHALHEDTFFLTYGDGFADTDVNGLAAFHRDHGKRATMTIVSPPGRFGAVELEGTDVVDFREKPQAEQGWINGGFFVVSRDVLDYIEGDSTTWERQPLERLAQEQNLVAYKHTGFWQCMDTLRDKRQLEALWLSGKAPWKIWD